MWSPPHLCSNILLCKWKTWLHSGVCLAKSKCSDVGWLLNPPFSATAYFLEICRNIFSILDQLFPFWFGCWSVPVMWEVLCAIAFHACFGSISPWKLGFLLRGRKLTFLQVKIVSNNFILEWKNWNLLLKTIKLSMSASSIWISAACQSSGGLLVKKSSLFM